MKKILFPTDFSEASHEAFIYALMLADKVKAEVITLHAYQLPDIHGVNLPHTLNEVYQSIELEEFENFRDSIPVLREIAADKGLDHISVSHTLKRGEAVKTILKFAEELQPDMIVMGTKGAGWLRDVFIGSVTSEVLENAVCPVLAVPTGVNAAEPIERIALTLELKKGGDKSVRKTLRYAKLLNATVTALYVDTAHTEAYSQNMARFAKEFEGESSLTFRVIDGTDVLSTVAEYVQENQYNLLVMTTHKRNFFQELWNYSLTKKMTKIAHVPILCFHGDDE